MFVLPTLCMALGLSAHIVRVQHSVYSVGACWRSELGEDMCSRYLALAGTPVIITTTIAVSVACSCHELLVVRHEVQSFFDWSAHTHDHMNMTVGMC